MGCSSIGRASEFGSEGWEFDPSHPSMETKIIKANALDEIFHDMTGDDVVLCTLEINPHIINNQKVYVVYENLSDENFVRRTKRSYEV